MEGNKVSRIGIIGTGMIATSLAALTTGHGYKTIVYTRSETSAAASRETYDTYYSDLIAKGLVTKEQAGVCAGYLSYARDYNGLADVDVIFECVIEALEVKQGVYRKIEKYCPKVKAICSVSSALTVDSLISQEGKYNDRIIVTHPFNPPHLVPYFELAQSEKTMEGVVGFARALLDSMGRKTVVLKKTAPGFIGNRLQFALWREALYIIGEGIADPKDIDTCLQYSFCPRYTSIGIFDHFDNGGLDLNITVCRTLFPVLSDEKEAPKSISDKIDAGDLGQKTGVGFYDWRGVDMDAYREKVNAPYWGFFDWDLPLE